MVRCFSIIILIIFLCPAICFGIEGLPGSTWGGVSNEVPIENGSHNIIARGWVEQGIDWKRWGNTTFNTYATLNYVWDKDGNDWNNKIGPGAGVSLKIRFPGLSLRLGTEYVYEKEYRGTADTRQKIIVYSTWYGSWDLLR